MRQRQWVRAVRQAIVSRQKKKQKKTALPNSFDIKWIQVKRGEIMQEKREHNVMGMGNSSKWKKNC
jgi:hypothetical protein